MSGRSRGSISEEQLREIGVSPTVDSTASSDGTPASIDEILKGYKGSLLDLAQAVVAELFREVRRLRAELDKAMAIGGVNRCEGCKTALVAEPQFYCRDCRP